MEKDLVWYVAGPWADRPRVREIIKKLNDAGWQTNSRWAEPDNPDIDPNDPEKDKKLYTQAARDVEDVAMADGLIYVNSLKSEGKATELGICIGMLKPIIVIGCDRGREGNIFLNLNIPIHNTIEEAMAWLDTDGGEQYINWVMGRQFQYLATMAGMGLVGGEDVSDVEFPSE